MESKVKLLGHPVHQMLIAFPLGLLGTAVIFDIIHALFDEPDLARAAWYMITAGILSGLLAALPGAVDWLTIPSGTRAKRVASLHGVGNVLIVATFAVAWLLRLDAPHDADAASLSIELVALVAALGTAWLGGELIDRLGVGVDRGANLNAPSSLTGPIAG